MNKRARPIDISENPVTFEEFARFIRSGRYWERKHWIAPPPDNVKGDAILRRIGFEWNRRQEPVTNVTWFEADAYCRSVGGRLPYSTELPEWYERLLRPRAVTPEWCGEYFSPDERGPDAKPGVPNQRRVFGWSLYEGAVPELAQPDFSFRVVFEVPIKAAWR